MVRVEAGGGPRGGYYNSCSFSQQPGISSPQGQEAVSGILIGKSELIFTSLQIFLHLLVNEARFHNVWHCWCFQALAKDKNAGKINAIFVFVKPIFVLYPEKTKSLE